MIKLRRRSKSDMQTMIIGLIILIVCLIACIIHVSDLYGSFKSTQHEEFLEELSDSMETLKESAEEKRVQAEELSKNFILEDGELTADIQSTLTAMKNDDFVYLYFWYMDGAVYDENGSIDKENFITTMDRLKLCTHSTSELHSVSGQSEGYITAIIPVTIQNTIVGYFLAEYDPKTIIVGNAYSYLKTNGSFYLMDSTANIAFAEDEHLHVVESGGNLYNSVLAYSDQGTKVKTILNSLRRDFLKKDTFDIRFTSFEGNTIYAMGKKVDTISNCYYIGIYNEDVLLDSIKPVILRSVVTCSVIILLMISLIIYVWGNGKQSNTMIEKLAYEDTITGGRNTNYFRDKALQIMTSNRETPYIAQRFDICNFRYINEAYGHNRADEVLKSCIVLSKQYFDEKELCVRMDSDQFLMLNINDTSVDQKRIDYTKAVNEYARSIGVKYPIRLKFGVYQIRKQDLDIDLIIDRANVARKSLDGDEKKLIAYYSDALVQDMRKVDKIESEMNNALKTGEFKMYLQPKWDIIKDQLVGAEALVRWIKPDGTVVFPSNFIPIFENNGFIEKLDFFMLETVCREMKKRIDKGLAVCPVSVNQSRLLLHNPEYVNNVSKILRTYSIPRKYIELELTETVFFDDRDKMLEMMNQLKEQHVRLSMDDFGSGYSSLNLLKDIPFDVLKIDREFFSEAITSESSTWILRKIVEMAEGLGIEVICEGVETDEQIEILKTVGCHLVQGYYYSKPISLEEFIQKYGDIQPRKQEA